MQGAPQNGDGRVEADFAIMRLTAQPRHKVCIFSNVAPKIVRKRGKCKKKNATLSRLVENTKERPEVAWFTPTMRRVTGRPDVDVARIRARGQAKNFNRFESHTQHLSNEDESGRLKPDL